MTYRLSLLGPARLHTSQGSLPLERKTAAVLAYLALEGPVHKYRLAGWLWPDSGETAARNNMRQLLRRLRLAAGDLVLGEDRLELAPEAEVDVKQLSYLETPSLELLAQGAELLEGYDYDDCPDLEEWLEGARAELRQLRAHAARGEAERLEKAGNHKQALAYAQVWARIEPLSEEAHRQVIRLHYLVGDRGAALAAFEQCRRLLRDELGAEPLPETLELVRLVERGAELPGSSPRPRAAVLPAAVLRPPVLAGREREWAMMDEAWEQGKLIFLSGEAGVGKSRLAADFLASKGPFVLLESRPGDTHIPYASNTRYLRTLLARYSDFKLPEWARQTLAAWMPELGPAPSPEALGAPGGQNRFFEATLEVFRQVGLRGEGMMVDDLHYQDDPTMQLGAYLLSSTFPVGQPGNLRGYVACFRRGELSAGLDEGIDRLVEAGLAVRLELQPLPPRSVESLLEGLDLPQHEHLAPGLWRYTGGNPLFILETLKHLIETASLEQGLPARLAPPGRIAPLIQRRLQRLSPTALSLARCAAVAGTAFDLRLAAGVLERPAMELAEAHAELEAAQILQGNSFTHDLVYEAVLGGISTAVRQVLHGRTAQHLEVAGANPALVGQHWLEAGEGDKAARWLIQAAFEASALGLYKEIVELLERAIVAASSPALRLEARVLLADALGPVGRVEESVRAAREVLEETDDPRLRQRALSVLQNMYHGLGDYEAASAAIAEALELALELGEEDRTAAMRFAQARIARSAGRYAEAAELLESILPFYRQAPSRADLIQVLTLLGNTYNLVGRHAEAEPLLYEAFVIREAVGPAVQILAVSNWLYCLLCLGRPQEALPEAEAALTLGDYAIADHLRNNLALAYMHLGRLAEARAHCQILAEKAFDPNYRCMAWARLAALCAGSPEGEAALEHALRLHLEAKTPAARFTLIQAALTHGLPEQQAWAQQELQTLDPATLPWLLQPDYEGLKHP